MADITLCSNYRENGCTLFHQCKRAMTKPDKQWQSFANFDCWNGKECNGYYHFPTLQEAREQGFESKQEFWQDNHL